MEFSSSGGRWLLPHIFSLQAKSAESFEFKPFWRSALKILAKLSTLLQCFK